MNLHTSRESLGLDTIEHMHHVLDCFAGLYLSGSHSKLPQGDVAAIRKHLQSQVNLNFNFLVYSLTTQLVIAYNSQSVEAYTSVALMLGEIAYRAYSIYLLQQVAAQYKEDEHFSATSLTKPPPVERHSEVDDSHFTSEEEAEYENDDSFPSAIQEERYDSQKEGLCPNTHPLCLCEHSK